MRIISIVTTNHSLDFDDRVNKESESMMKCGHTVEFIALETQNQKRIGYTGSGARFQTVHLATRNIFSSGNGLVFKLLEWNFKILLILTTKKWDAIWLNDFDGIAVLFYARFVKIFFPSRKIVWDHHELAPERLLRNRGYSWLVSFCDVIVHANADRVEYTKKYLPTKSHSKFVVIENYPDINFMKHPEQLQPVEFSTWLGGDDFCLFQGAALTYRKVFECIESIYSIPGMKMVIMGPCDEKTMKLLVERWPDYNSKVFITGWTPQKNFFGYMDQALVSLVFYENIDTNHWLCAPNRFFNAILRGIPVICGSNPPMRSIIENERLGLFCDSNGDDSDEIAEAIKDIRKDNEYYKQRCHIVKSKFVWENQDALFHDFFN